MKKTTKNLFAEKVKLTGKLSEFRDSLQEEIDEIENNGQSSTLLTSGHCIDTKENEFWYRFIVEYMPLLPADTPCKLTIGTEQFDVTVISSSENDIILSSKNKLPANIGKAKLENGSTILMERLIKCIEDNSGKPNLVGERMFPNNAGIVYQAKHVFSYDHLDFAEHSNKGQKEAVESALQNDITYIWGPPGTGKTTVICNIIDELYKHNRTVLIISHTNTAVDGAISKYIKVYMTDNKDSQAPVICPVLRLGIPTEKIPREALLESHIELLGKELISQRNSLENQGQQILAQLEKIRIALVKKDWLKNSRLSEIKELNARLIELQKKSDFQMALLSKATTELEEKIQSYPKGKDFASLEKTYQEKTNELKVVKDKLASMLAKLDHYKAQQERAEDEIKKHILSEELTMKTRRYMSFPFYMEKISETKKVINVINISIQTLINRKESLQDQIYRYENKNAVSKFFANKAVFENNQIALARIKEEIQEKQNTLAQREKLLADYKKQLDELQLLQEKRQALKPSHTKMYWMDEIQRLERAISDTDTRFLENQRDALSAQVASIDAEKDKNRPFFDAVNQLQNEINTIKNNEKIIDANISESRESLAQLLKTELAFCEQFTDRLYVINNEQEIIQELSKLNEEVYKDLHHFDIVQLEKDKETYEGQRAKIQTELNEIQKKMAELEKQAIMNAQIIGTTLAKSYLSDILRERQFDTVILDEASMASIPALWCAAYLAEKNIVIVGDFLQLPPIVMASTPMAQKWLGRDIFDHSGMQALAKRNSPKPCPSNFIMLNEQYRMEADIADIANIYYGEYTLLRSNDNNPHRNKERDIFYSWYSGNKTKDHIHLIDTESLHAWVTGIPQAKGHSRLNTFSATIDVALAFKCLDSFIDRKLYESPEYKGTKVLIVAPYKPHVTLINKLIESEYHSHGINPESNLVKAGTIHSFQGSEADIVIFDLVIDEPHWKANLFLTDPDVNAGLEKMFNVAVTRAKFKLYIVGDFEYCQRRAKDNALSALLKKLIVEKKYIKVDAKKQLLPKLTIQPITSIMLNKTPDAEMLILTESEFHNYFLSDIHSFHDNMIIYSPFMTENRISIILPAFSEAISKGKRIVVITKPLTERKKTELQQYKKCEKALQDIGISILHKKGMHEKTILIDSDIIWTGSLNALSYTGNTGEIMERRKDVSKDKTVINSYIKILDINYLLNALENNYETKCPICGNEMLIAESEDGGIYWKCSAGDYSRNKDQPYPTDGILRCKVCNSSYIFSMKKQPRWICSADSKHYQCLRKNDLKLPQMAALLSPLDKIRVQEYFEQLSGKSDHI